MRIRERRLINVRVKATIYIKTLHRRMKRFDYVHLLCSEATYWGYNNNNSVNSDDDDDDSKSQNFTVLNMCQAMY